MGMERLPVELITNILFRLPFKSIGRCRCVSKPWHTILTDSTFQLTQLSNTNPQDILLMYGEIDKFKFYHLEDNQVAAFLDEDEDTRNSIKPLKRLDDEILHCSYDGDLLSLGVCNGLMCMSFSKNASNRFPVSNPIILFNLITREQSELPELCVPECEFEELAENGYQIYGCCSGFGFESSTMEFKLVLAMFYAEDLSGEKFNSELQVYTLGSECWRTKIGVVPDVLKYSSAVARAVVVSGSIHWIVPPFKGVVIVSFDLGIEEFGFVPPPKSPLNYPVIDYELGTIEECLSIVDSNYECTDVWVMKQYNVEESWVKQYSIRHDSVSSFGLKCPWIQLIKLHKNDELLLVLSAKHMVHYNLATQNCRLLKIEGIEAGNSKYLEAYTFIGSLISQKAVFGMDNVTYV